MAEKKIKIYHVLTDRNIGGAGRWLLYYLKYCDRTHFDVRVVLPKDSLLVAEVEKLGIPVMGMESMADSSWDKKALQPLIRLFQKDKPDVVHTHASLTARIAARKAGVKRIFHTKHCMEAEGNALKKMAKRMLNHRYSDCIIAVSEAVKRSMEAGGTDAKQIVTIYNGIDPVAPLSTEEKQKVRQSFGIPEGQKAVGIAARLEEVKDHKTFLQAAEILAKTHADLTFLIIGDGSLREYLEAEAKVLGLQKRVIFTGFVQEVEKLEAALDLAVITSKQEALCLSLIESMSAGVPAVGTDSGGVSEVIRHGENGFLVPVGDSGALAKRIEEILYDEARYKEMQKNAAAWTRKQFTADKMAAQMEKLYTEGWKK